LDALFFLESLEALVGDLLDSTMAADRRVRPVDSIAVSYRDGDMVMSGFKHKKDELEGYREFLSPF
jgi:hypothetical protein